MLSATEQQQIFHLAHAREEMASLTALNAAIHSGDVSALQELLANRDSRGIPRLDINLYRALGQALYAPLVNEEVVGVLLALKDREGYPIVELNQTYGRAEETVIELVLKLSIENPTVATFGLQYRLLSALLALQNRYGQRAVKLDVHALHQPLLKQTLAAGTFGCFQLLSTVLMSNGAYALPINEIHHATTVLDLALMEGDQTRIDFIRALGGQQAHDVVQARALPMAKMINASYVDDAILLEDYAALDNSSDVSYRVLDALPAYAMHHTLTAAKQLEALTAAIHAVASQRDDRGHYHAATVVQFKNKLANLHHVFENQAVYVQKCSPPERQRLQESSARDVDVLAHNYRQFLLLDEITRAFLTLQTTFTPVLDIDDALFATINTLINTAWQSLMAMTFNAVSIDALLPALHASIVDYKNSQPVAMRVDNVSWLVALDQTMHQAMALHARLPVVFIETAEMISLLKSDRLALSVAQEQLSHQKADVLSRYADELSTETGISAGVSEEIRVLYHEFVVRVSLADITDYCVQRLMAVKDSAWLDQRVHQSVFNALNAAIATVYDRQAGDLLTLDAHSKGVVEALNTIITTVQLAWSEKKATESATLIHVIQAVIHGVETVWSERYLQDIQTLISEPNAITRLHQVLTEKTDLSYNGPRTHLTVPNAILIEEVGEENEEALSRTSNAVSPSRQMSRDMDAFWLTEELMTSPLEYFMREMASCFPALWQDPDGLVEERSLAPNAPVHQPMRTLSLSYEAFENAALNLGQGLLNQRFDS